jgi:hypothetical protein
VAVVSNTRFVIGPLVVVAVMAGLVTSCADPSSSSAAGARESAAPSPSSREVERCPVTVPPAAGFVPPGPYPPKPSSDGVWYGSAELWTILDSRGAVWSDLPVGKNGHVGDKTLWFSEKFSTAEGEDFSGNADITVTAVHRGGSAPKVVEGGVPSFNGHIRNFLLVGLSVPEPGCWEVNASYQGAELSYVMLVKD